MLVGSVIKQVYQFPLHQIEVIQFKDSRYLKNQDFYYSSQRPKLFIIFEIIDELEEHFCKEEAIGVGFCFSDQETLIPQASFRANSHQKLDYVPQPCIVIGFRVKFLQHIADNLVSAHV